MVRPRSVILFEAKLEGDVPSGKVAIWGIDFTMPGGSAPSLASFSFRRVPK
jgi:hypothetical protein